VPGSARSSRTRSATAPGDTPEVTAQAICRQVVSLTSVLAAHFYLFELDERAQSIGFVVEAIRPTAAAVRIPTRSADPRAGRRSPWIEPGSANPRARMSSSWRAWASLCCVRPCDTASAHRSALRIHGRISQEVASPRYCRPSRSSPTWPGGHRTGRGRADRAWARRDHIAGIIERRDFRPVFQPIVELASNEIVATSAHALWRGTNPEFCSRGRRGRTRGGAGDCTLRLPLRPRGFATVRMAQPERVAELILRASHWALSRRKPRRIVVE